jgi:MFS superfamily sulfate permease-like transporter
VVVPWAAWLMFFLFVGRYGTLTTAAVSNVLVGLVEGIALTVIIKQAPGRRAHNIVLGAASLVAVLIWALVPVLGE